MTAKEEARIEASKRFSAELVRQFGEKRAVEMRYVLGKRSMYDERTRAAHDEFLRVMAL